jgi:integrase
VCRYAASGSTRRIHSRRYDAEEWALEVERSIDRGVPIKRSRPNEQPKIFADLITLHIDDLVEVGKPIRRSKAAVMESLKISLGRVRISDLTRERLIEFGKKRAKQGAGPATLAIDFSFIRTVMSHVAAVHGIEVPTENVRLARIALQRLGLVGKGNERDRRPTQDELDRIIEHAENNPRQFIPLARMVRFAVATAMRLDEICRIEWTDVDLKKKTVKVRNRKDPRRSDSATARRSEYSGCSSRDRRRRTARRAAEIRRLSSQLTARWSHQW